MTPDTADTTRKPEKPPEGALGWLSWALLATGIVAMVAYGATWDPHSPPRLPAFEFTSQEGKKVSLRFPPWQGLGRDLHVYQLYQRLSCNGG